MLQRAWLVSIAAVVVVWAAALAWRTAGGLCEAWAAAARGLTETPAQRIQRASGITPAFAAAIRASMPADGRLVLFSPYAHLPAGEGTLRLFFEQAKNLLYPVPRDVAFARNADELRRQLAPGYEGRLLVIDGTQEAIDLAIGGQYELVHQEPIGNARLRIWRLQKVL